MIYHHVDKMLRREEEKRRKAKRRVQYRREGKSEVKRRVQ